LRLSG